MNRRFALLQVVFSVIALAAVVWWASHQEAPTFPHTSGALGWMGAAAALYAARHGGAGGALAPHPRGHRGPCFAGRLLRA
ncbi:MAG: hypothetical protein WKF40_02455 [Thermoleophilaceae bacterium]